MELRLTLGALIVLCGALLGKSIAGVSARRAETLAELMDGMQMLKIHMLDHLCPVHAALEKSQSAILRGLSASMARGSAAQAWREIKREEARRGGRLDCLLRADLEVLDDFFESLGTGSGEEQRQSFGAAIRRMGQLENEAREECRRRGRLYTTIGALMGTAVLVVIL